MIEGSDRIIKYYESETIEKRRRQKEGATRNHSRQQKVNTKKWLNCPEDNQKLVKHKKKSENVAATEKKIIMMMMGWAGQANSKQQLSIDHNFNNISDDQLAPSFFLFSCSSFIKSNQFSRRFITLFLLLFPSSERSTKWSTQTHNTQLISHNNSYKVAEFNSKINVVYYLKIPPTT